MHQPNELSSNSSSHWLEEMLLLKQEQAKAFQRVYYVPRHGSHHNKTNSTCDDEMTFYMLLVLDKSLPLLKLDPANTFQLSPIW
jgi:hypothetical protein